MGVGKITLYLPEITILKHVRCVSMDVIQRLKSPFNSQNLWFRQRELHLKIFGLSHGWAEPGFLWAAPLCL